MNEWDNKCIDLWWEIIEDLHERRVNNKNKWKEQKEGSSCKCNLRGDTTLK